MKAKRKIISTIYLTEEQQVLLKELSNKSKVPVAEYIRQGVDMVLKKNNQYLPGQLSFTIKNQKNKKIGQET